jgi:hypothetical protein
LTEWFFDRLAARLRTTPAPLNGRAEARAEQARQMMPPGLASTCGTRSAPLVPNVDFADRNVVGPRIVSSVRPVYPGAELTARRGAVILFEWELTEHGTVINPRLLDSGGAPDSFVIAARSAQALWRFVPAMTADCAVRTYVTMQLSFSSR